MIDEIKSFRKDWSRWSAAERLALAALGAAVLWAAILWAALEFALRLG